MNLPLEWVGDEVPGSGLAETPEAIPWEDPDQPILVALVHTIGMILTRPGEFFRHLDLQGGLAVPLGFALILGTAGMLASLYWQLIQLLLIGNMGSWVSLLITNSVNLGPRLVVGISLMVPVLVLATQFVSSFFLLLAVLLVGGRQPSFEAAFRVIAYSNAPLVATFLPVAGGIMASLWCLIVEFKALLQVFNLSRLRALLALLLASFFSLIIFGILTLVGGALLLI
ncbi:MAG: YIP1 family protein [Desulfobacteraceae bacterium]